MLAGEFRERLDRSIPVVARSVREDRSGVEQLAGAVYDGDLDARAQARVQSNHSTRTGRRRQQQVMQIAREYADGLFLSALPQGREQIAFELPRDLRAPRPAYRLAEPCIGRTPLIGYPKASGDHSFGTVLANCGFGEILLLGQFERQLENALLAAAEQRQRAVRGDILDAFGIREVVTEFCTGLLLTVGHNRHHPAVSAQVFAQPADQLGVLA